MDVDTVVKDLGLSRAAWCSQRAATNSTRRHTGRHGSFGFSCYCVEGVATRRLSPG